MASGLAAFLSGALNGRIQTRAAHYASDDLQAQQQAQQADASQRMMAAAWDKMQKDPGFKYP